MSAKWPPADVFSARPTPALQGPAAVSCPSRGNYWDCWLLIAAGFVNSISYFACCWNVSICFFDCSWVTLMKSAGVRQAINSLVN